MRKSLYIFFIMLIVISCGNNRENHHHRYKVEPKTKYETPTNPTTKRYLFQLRDVYEERLHIEVQNGQYKFFEID